MLCESRTEQNPNLSLLSIARLPLLIIFRLSYLNSVYVIEYIALVHNLNELRAHEQQFDFGCFLASTSKPNPNPSKVSKTVVCGFRLLVVV